MHLKLFFVALLASLAASPARAEKAVQCDLKVFCRDSAQSSRGTLVYHDTAEFVRGIRATGFMANFSLEVTFEQIDTGATTFSVQLVTLGPSAYNDSRRFTAEYKLPAIIDNIPGKGNTTFSLVVTPLRASTVDTAGCGWLHYRKDDFLWDPSANIDIYYVQRTLGDYLWNAVKANMEDRYRAFASLNRFNLPGKYLLYLCPCMIHSVIWDTRFGTMIDPTRSLAFVLLSKGVNSADPFVLMHASILRNYGYTPPFLSEGFAGYMSFSLYDMKQLVKARKIIPIDSVLNGDQFYHGDPKTVDVTISSFVRYLIDQYKADKFLAAYRQANDLNLKQTLESVYGKPLASLEKEWLAYVDTTRLRYDQFAFWASQSELMLNYPQMLTYRQAELSYATSAKDSLSAFKDLSRAYFFNGDYQHAVEAQRQAAVRTDSSAQEWMALGSYLMMSGAYDSAYDYLSRARTMDTANQLIIFNLAMYYAVTGQEKKATDLISTYTEPDNKNPAMAESRVLLGNLLLLTGNHADEGLANGYFREAFSMLAPFTSGSLITSSALMWSGIAELGLRDTPSANDYLNMSLFLENSPFYIGMDYLWLGKTADLRGERDVAVEFYRKVLANASADYHKKEAQQLLNKPFTR